MPQLDTSTWFITISSMIMSLFLFLQLKISTHTFHHNPKNQTPKTVTQKTPWEKKWTKTYSPLSLHQQF